MSEEMQEYASWFPVGRRVRVGIPLATGGTFPEWGVVSSLERDLLGLELSRDSLPEEAVLERGRTLLMRFPGQEPGHEESEHCCRGVIVGEAAGGTLALRLVEGVLRYEPREYFRQDVYLPVDYRIPPAQAPEEVRQRWFQGRRDQEFAAQKPEPGEPPGLTAQREEIRARLEQRGFAPPSAANLSGGGVRIDIEERLVPGTLVELTFYLPAPLRVLEIVGEVVDVKPQAGPGGHSTALRYRFIDEADRDRIIAYLSAEQLAQLARSGHGSTIPSVPSGVPTFSRLRVLLGILLLASLIAYLSHSIVAKRERGEKHEIERLFEDGVANYLRQRR